MVENKYLLTCFSCCLIAFTNNIEALKPLPNKKYFHLEELMGTTNFKNVIFNGTWISGTELTYSKSDEGGIFLYNMANHSSTLFIPENILDTLKTREIDISPDRKFLLAKTDTLRDHLQMYSWRFSLYDINNGNLTLLANHNRMRLCMFTRDHSIIYVADNNIFYIWDILKSSIPVKLTTDGIPGAIYNGVTDYMYGDLFFKHKRVTWISKGGHWIAMAYFDDSKVDDVTFYTYGKINSVDDQYPTERRVRYPQCGKTNPTAKVKVLNLDNASNATWMTFNAPEEMSNEDPLLGTVRWASADKLAILWINRAQNRSILVTCDVTTKKCTNDVFNEAIKGWIELTTPVFSRFDGNSFLDIIPISQKGNSSGDWYHLAKYTRGKISPVPITSGLRTVIDIEGWVEELDLIYYTSTLEENPWDKHLFVAGSRFECVSCSLKSPFGELCSYVDVNFSLDDKYFALTCNSRSPSYTVLYDAQTVKLVMIWQDNAILRKEVDNHHFPKTSYFQIPIPNSRAYVKLFLPPELDPEETNVTYPMIIEIYSAPSIAKVLKRQKANEYEIFAPTNRSYVYARIEGRASALKGKDLLFGVYEKSGTVEIDDVITGTKKLLELYPFIDKKNVALWGWSYGGYASLIGLARDYDNIYKCGISVAPVIDLGEFLSMRSEKYLGLPVDNMQGYENANILNHVQDLRGKKFAILLGVADENAHFKKMMRLFQTLLDAGIDFEQMSYPDEAHSLLGVVPHVYHFIDDFFSRCFSS